MADTPWPGGGGDTSGGSGGSSGGPSPEGWTSPMSLISWASGRSITSVAKTGIAGWLTAVFASVATSTQWLFNLVVVVPAEVMSGIIREAGGAFFIDPLDAISTAVDATADAAAEFGILSLPVAVAVILATYWMYTQYLQQEQTSDLIPGAMTDLIPFVGVEEDGEE